MKQPKRINTFREYRLRSGLSREEVISLLDISESYLEKIENDYRTPGKDILFKMAEIYNCRVEELYYPA